MSSAALSLPADSDRRQRIRGFVLTLAAALLWSVGGLIVRLLQDVDVWTLVFWRSLTALVFLVLLGVAFEGPRFVRSIARMGWPGLIIALCYTVASIAFVVAVTLTTVADVLVIMACAPLLAALFARLLLGERLGRSQWLAMVMSVAGVIVMVSGSYAHGSITGDLVAAAIAIAQAVAAVTFRRFRSVSMIPGLCLATALSTLLVAPLASMAIPSPRQLGLLTFFGAGELGLGLALFASGARLIPAAQAAMIGVLEPVVGPLWVWAFLDERPGPAGLFGGGVVIAALVLFTLAGARSRPGPAQISVG